MTIQDISPNPATVETYKIGGKKVQIPSGWHDVPFYKGLEIMRDNPNKVDSFCILTGLDRSFVRTLKDPGSIELFMGTFQFLNNFNFNPELPLSIMYDGAIIPLPDVDHSNPFDLGNAEVGQIEDMEVILKKEFSDPEKVDAIQSVSVMPKIIAIYLQKIIDKEYDFKKSQKMVSAIEQTMSFKDVLCMGYFFFQKLKDYTSGFQGKSRKQNWMKKKLKQASMTFRSHLAGTLR